MAKTVLYRLSLVQGQAVDDGIGLRKQPKTSEDDDFSQVSTYSKLTLV